MTTRRRFRYDLLNPTFRFISFLVAVLFLLAGTTATLHAATIVVPAGGDLQSAINTAQPGDTIVVEAAATFVGSFFLPDKGPCSPCSYITIQSSAVANLPSGVRVGPSNAANMPKLVSDGSGSSGSYGGASNQPVIGSMPSAHHWKLVGLELVPSSTSSTVKSIVQLETFGQGPGNTSQIPHHIIIDRCYIHSLSGDASVVRGIALNSTDSEVTNSHISEIHGSITDSQAIFAHNTPGRLTIDNNYLEAASECVQFGYGDPAITPDGISFTRNHVTRPLAWRSLYGNVKNLLEMKGGTNVRIEGNTFENNWADGQSGHAIVLSAYYNDINYVSITNNIIRHTGAGFSIGGSPNLGGLVDHITVSNNLIEDINPTTYNNPWTGTSGGGFLLQIGNSSYVSFNHNTNVQGNDIRISGNDFVIAPNFSFTNNIGSCVNGIAILESIANNSGVVRNNLQPWYAGGHSGTEQVYGFQNLNPTLPVPAWPQVTLYPSLNGSMFWFTEDRAQVGFIDPNSNYRLSSSSLYKSRATDGKDVGCDFDALEAAMGGTAPPTPSPTPTPTSTPSPLPTPTVTPTPSPQPTPTVTPTPVPTPIVTPTPSPLPTPPSTGDVVWVDDSLPAGATPMGDGEHWNWVSGNPGPYSGALANQSALVAGFHQHYFTGATATLAVNAGDILSTYIFIDPNYVPSEIMLQWNDGSWEHRAYWGSNVFNWGSDGTNSRRFMGSIPAAGQWVRLEVPASQVGLEGKTITGMAFTLHGGSATWDRAGKSSQAAPSPTPADFVWVEDNTPAGATLYSDNDSWNWVGSSPTPYSGAMANQSAVASGMHQQFFQDATATLTCHTGDTLFAYVFIDPSNVPDAIMLQWNDGTWDHRAYWGSNSIVFGIDGTNSRRFKGALPPSGQWVRLEVPASQVGLEGKTIHGMAFTLHGGRASWDRAGKAATASNANPIDDARNFVRQHYLDFLGREPDLGGWDYWTQQITSCPAGNATCVQSRRISVTAAFFVEQEFQQTGSFVYRFYRSSLGRQPSYAEFLPDRAQVVASPNLEANKQSLANAWVQRTEFLQKYPAWLTGTQFIDALLQTVQQTSGADPWANRSALINDWNAYGSRARIVRMVADMPAVVQADYNPSFVLMQYFGYLRRDPDPGGYGFWLDVLNNRAPNNHRGMVCAFITSAEYQLRFGALVTHTNGEC